MRRAASWQCLALAWVLLLGLSVGHAQQSATGPSADSQAPARVEEQSPEIYLVPGPDGKLHKLVNVPLEEFREFLEQRWRDQRKPQDEAPAFQLDLTAEGRIAARHAELTMRVDVRVASDDWLPVPLRLNEAVLRSPVETDGPGQALVVPAADGRGLVAWIRADPDSDHTISLRLDLLVPIARTQGENRLALTLPAASTAEITWTMPAEVEAVRSTPTGSVFPKTGDGGEVQLVALSWRGACELIWRESAPHDERAMTVLSASGRILARIDGTSVHAQALLQVQSLGGAFDRFRVRLPQGARPLATTYRGYRVVPLANSPDDESANDASPGPHGDIVEILLDEAVSESVEVRIDTEQPLPSDPATTPLNVSGFEVLEAGSQSGFLGLTVLGDWELAVDQRRSMQSVGDGTGVFPNGSVQAAYEYLAQPSVLSIRVTPRRSRLRIEPEYRFHVHAQHIDLEMTLRCAVRGKALSQIDIDMLDEGWEIVDITGDQRIRPAAVDFSERRPFSIELTSPAEGAFEVKVMAQRPWDAGASELTLRPPVPVAETLSLATIWVVADENVELTPRADQIAQLSRQSPPPTLVGSREHPPLLYRGSLVGASFVAGSRVLPREMSVAITSTVQLDDAETRIEQVLDYRILNEPQDRLLLAVPGGLTDRELPLVRLDGTTLDVALISGVDLPVREGARVLQVRLPAPRLGSCPLVVSHRQAHEAIMPETTVLVDIPLILPADAQARTHRVTVTTRPGVKVQPRGEDWTVSSAGSSAGPAQFERGRAVRLAPREATSPLTLLVTLDEIVPLEGTIVDRAWLQSWLSDRARRDRALYRLSTSRPQLRIELPERVVRRTVQVFLDQTEVSPNFVDERTLAIALTAEPVRRAHLIELRYQFPEEQRTWGRLDLVPPRFQDEAGFNRTYWQLVLPRHEHLLTSQGSFTREFTWHWRVPYFARQPLLEQFDLENWVGAPHATQLPDNTNRYLFSLLGDADALVVRTGALWMIVLISSGAVLVVGLLWLYVPVLRRAGVLLAAAVLLWACGLLFPEPVVLIGQSAALGLVLALIAVLLDRGLIDRRRQELELRPSASSYVTGSARPIAARPSSAGSQASTEDGPVAVPLPASDSKS